MIKPRRLNRQNGRRRTNWFQYSNIKGCAMLAAIDLGYWDCCSCGTRVRHTFVDLGMAPPCQTHIVQGELNHEEPFRAIAPIRV